MFRLLVHFSTIRAASRYGKHSSLLNGLTTSPHHPELTWHGLLSVPEAIAAQISTHAVLHFGDKPPTGTTRCPKAHHGSLLDGLQPSSAIIDHNSTTRDQKTSYISHTRRLEVVKGLLVQCLTTTVYRVQCGGCARRLAIVKHRIIEVLDDWC
jgi:hypothetical protein